MPFAWKSRLYHLVKDHSIHDLEEKLREARKDAHERHVAFYE